STHDTTLENQNLQLETDKDDIETAYEIEDKWNTYAQTIAKDQAQIVADGIPVFFIVGLSDGGDIGEPAKAGVKEALTSVANILEGVNATLFTAYQIANASLQTEINNNSISIANSQLDTETKNAVLS